MKGCRPLSDMEVAMVLDSIKGINKARTAALFIIGVRTGFRISELLSVRIQDLIFEDKIVDELRIERRHMKGGKKGKANRIVATSRAVPLNPETHSFVREQLQVLRDNGWLRPDSFFFQSRKRGNKGSSG